MLSKLSLCVFLLLATCLAGAEWDWKRFDLAQVQNYQSMSSLVEPIETVPFRLYYGADFLGLALEQDAIFEIDPDRLSNLEDYLSVPLKSTHPGPVFSRLNKKEYFHQQDQYYLWRPDEAYYAKPEEGLDFSDFLVELSVAENCVVEVFTPSGLLGASYSKPLCLPWKLLKEKGSKGVLIRTSAWKGNNLGLSNLRLFSQGIEIKKSDGQLGFLSRSKFLMASTQNGKQEQTGRFSYSQKHFVKASDEKALAQTMFRLNLDQDVLSLKLNGKKLDLSAAFISGEFFRLGENELSWEMEGRADYAFLQKVSFEKLSLQSVEIQVPEDSAFLQRTSSADRILIYSSKGDLLANLYGQNKDFAVDLSAYKGQALRVLFLETLSFASPTALRWNASVKKDNLLPILSDEKGRLILPHSASAIRGDFRQAYYLQRQGAVLAEEPLLNKALYKSEYFAMNFPRFEMQKDEVLSDLKFTPAIHPRFFLNKPPLEGVYGFDSQGRPLIQVYANRLRTYIQSLPEQFSYSFDAISTKTYSQSFLQAYLLEASLLNENLKWKEVSRAEFLQSNEEALVDFAAEHRQAVQEKLVELLKEIRPLAIKKGGE